MERKKEPEVVSRIWISLLLAGCMACPVLGAAPIENDENNDGKPDLWISTGPSGTQEVSADRDFDGRVDHLVVYDGGRNRIREEQDYNRDGSMDDFYFYKTGTLVRREIDTNYDGNVDLWIFLSEGVYVEGYDRDTDFDGVVDVRKRYGSP